MFQLLMVLRCFRPDRVIPAIIEVVGAEMGNKFASEMELSSDSSPNMMN